MAERMVTIKGYLRFNPRTITGVTKNAPALDFGELCCGISLTVPAAAFKRPVFDVDVRFGGDFTQTPSEQIETDIEKLFADNGFTAQVLLVPDQDQDEDA